MPSAKTITKNAGWLFIANIVSSVVGFILILLIARFLGDENLGLYSFAFAFTSMFAVFFEFGVFQFSLKEIARDKTKTEEYYWNLIAIRFFLGLVALVIPILILYFYGVTPLTLKVVTIAGLATFFNYSASLFRVLFEAYEIMEFEAITSIIERIVALSVGGAVLYLGGSIVVFVFVLLFSYFIYFLISYYFTSKKISKFSFKIDLKFWMVVLKRSLPFWFSMLFLKIYFQIDTIMLSGMENYVVTGWYNAAYSLVNGLSFIPFVVINATFPVMSVLHKKNKSLLKLLFNRCFSYLFIIGFPIAIGTFLLSKRIILFFYKEQFINSSIALQILIWAELFLFVNYLMGFLLNSIDKQKLFTYSTGACVIINITLNLILIPKMSYIGAAIATVITEVINFSMLFYFTSEYGYAIRLFSLVSKPILASLIMVIFIYFFGGLNILIIIPLAAMIYFGILFLIKGIGGEEVGLIKLMLKRG